MSRRKWLLYLIMALGLVGLALLLIYGLDALPGISNIPDDNEPLPGIDDTEAPSTSDTLVWQDFSGYVWQDNDWDGKPDDGEQVLSGVTVQLVDNWDMVRETTVTGPDGWYDFSFEFDSDPAERDKFSNFRVRVIPPGKDWHFTKIPKEKDNTYNQFDPQGYSRQIELQDTYLYGDLVLSAGIVPPIPVGDTPEPVKRYIWSPYGWFEIVHLKDGSVLWFKQYFLDLDLETIPDVELYLELEHPDGEKEQKLGTSDEFGMVELRFDIDVFGEYAFRVLDVSRSGYEHYGQYDHGIEWIVTVDASEGIYPLTPQQVDAFYGSFNLGMKDGNFEALLKELHPEVFNQYNEDQCRSYLQSIVEKPIQIEVQDVPEFGPWQWQVGNTPVDILNVYTIDIQTLLPDGTVSSQQTHLGIYLDAQGMPALGWFTYCDALEGN